MTIQIYKGNGNLSYQRIPTNLLCKMEPSENEELGGDEIEVDGKIVEPGPKRR